MGSCAEANRLEVSNRAGAKTMKFHIDFIDTHFCSPLFDHPSQKPPTEKAGDKCEVELLLQEPGKTMPIRVFLKRLNADQDLFIWQQRSKADRKNILYLKEKGWNIPHGEIARSIRLEHAIKQSEELFPLLVGQENLEALRGDLVSLILFGNPTEVSATSPDTELHSRILRTLYQFTGTHSQLNPSLDAFLARQLGDPVWNHGEKQQMKWLRLGLRLMKELRTGFSGLNDTPQLEQALEKVLLYWLSPGTKISNLPMEDEVQKAAVLYFQHHRPSRPPQINSPDLYQTLRDFLNRTNQWVAWRDLPWLQTRTNQLLELLKSAINEEWSYLLTLKDPEKALKEGLVLKYGATPLEKDMMRLFADHVSLVKTQGSRHPELYINMTFFSKRVQEKIQEKGLPPDKRKAMLGFLSETILQKLMAKGHNMRVFWDGAFRRRVNFYPNFALGFERPAWSRLIDWTRSQLQVLDPELSQPHVLLNKTALGIDGGLLLAGAGTLLSGALLDERNSQVAGLGLLGAGLGAAAGNLLCYWANLSNRWGQCDIIGAVAGGLLGGLSGAFGLAPSQVGLPMMMPPLPPPPDPGERKPTDAYGP